MWCIDEAEGWLKTSPPEVGSLKLITISQVMNACGATKLESDSVYGANGEVCFIAIFVSSCVYTNEFPFLYMQLLDDGERTLNALAVMDEFLIWHDYLGDRVRGSQAPKKRRR
jgi:hypothetical protein